MALPKIPGLKRKGSEKKNFTVKVDAELIEELEELEKRLEGEDSSYALARGEVVEDALRNVIRLITAELDKPRAKAASV